VASGEILDGEQPPGTIGGDSTAKLIREARNDKDVKAVVLRVNSPGGSVLASEEIYRELVALRASGKPLVVSMGGYAASGGYYISAPADEIWANPATITGSIGIFAIIPTVDKTLGKIGVSVDGVGTTALSGQARIDRPLSEGAKAVLQSVTTHGYDEFVARVAAGRKKTTAEVDSIAQGRVWAGTDAKRIGLVDELGSFNDAVKSAAQRAKLSDYSTKFIEPKLTWAETLAMNLKSGFIRNFVHLSVQDQAMLRLAERLDPVTQQAAALARFSEPNRLYAYCFCEVR
jgi:protease-4